MKTLYLTCRLDNPRHACARSRVARVLPHFAYCSNLNYLSTYLHAWLVQQTPLELTTTASSTASSDASSTSSPAGVPWMCKRQSEMPSVEMHSRASTKLPRTLQRQVHPCTPHVSPGGRQSDPLCGSRVHRRPECETHPPGIERWWGQGAATVAPTCG